MQIKLEADGRRLVAALRGELDHHAAGSVREKIDGAVVSNDTKELILDFSDVGFMDSSGIGLILGRYKLMRGKSGSLHIRGVSDRYRRMMQMAGLEKLNIFEEDHT